jgi:peptidoglycan hydrolase CwlO-like protein
MRTRLLVSSFIVGLSLATFGCAAHHKEAGTAETTKADLSPIEELKAIPEDLNASVQDIMKPIDDTQSVIDQVTSLPKRYKLNAKDVMGMASASVQSGQVNVNFDAKATIAEDAKAEVTTALTKLTDIVTGLKATPDKVAALGKKLATVSAKVPVLSTRVTSEATITVGNPMASADSKAKAQANIDGVKQIQATVQASIKDTQAKISGIPAMATTALGKITAAFAGAT